MKKLSVEEKKLVIRALFRRFSEIESLCCEDPALSSDYDSEKALLNSILLKLV